MPLAAPDDPLGGIMDAAMTVIPSSTDIQRHAAAVKQRLTDLPDIPERMNTISVVLMYEFFGLSDEDVAVALGIELQQVVNIKALDVYNEFRDNMRKRIMEYDESDVLGYLKKHAKDAAKVNVDLLTHPRPDIAMAAARDVLDRSGHTAKQSIEVTNRLEADLRITIIRKSDNDEVPVIDVTPKVN